MRRIASIQEAYNESEIEFDFGRNFFFKMIAIGDDIGAFVFLFKL